MKPESHRRRTIWCSGPERRWQLAARATGLATAGDATVEACSACGSCDGRPTEGCDAPPHAASATQAAGATLLIKTRPITHLDLRLAWGARLGEAGGLLLLVVRLAHPCTARLDGVAGVRPGPS